MKLKNILQIRKVIENHKQDKMATNLAYKFVKFLKASDKEETFYDNQITLLFDEYSQKNEDGTIKNDGQSIFIVPELIDEFNKKLAELQDTEVDKPEISFTLKELENLSFTVDEMYCLDEFIND